MRRNLKEELAYLVDSQTWNLMVTHPSDYDRCKRMVNSAAKLATDIEREECAEIAEDFRAFGIKRAILGRQTL